VNVLQKTGYLHTLVTGELTLDVAREVVAQSVNASTQHACPRALIDIRETTLNFGLLDIHGVGALFAALTSGALKRVAVIGLDSDMRPDRALQAITRSRGLDFKIFSALADALIWIQHQAPAN
jgi:hypothetical protein